MRVGRSWLPAGIVGTVVMLIAGCASGGGHSGAASPPPSPAASAVVVEPAALIDVGGGARVYAQCSGAGSPTVVFENGDESDMGQWRFVIPRVATRTRVCAYNRLGVGASDVPHGCRQLKDLRAVLEAVLRGVHATPPYVVAGTSGGGFLVTGFAYAHPGDVKGILLAETPRAIIPSQSSAELLAEIRCDSASNVERRNYVSVENEAWAGRHRLGDIPMTVISNDYGTGYADEEQRTNVRAQKGWLVLSPQARQIVVTSGHNVPENEPDLVVQELNRILDALA